MNLICKYFYFNVTIINAESYNNKAIELFMETSDIF